MLLKTGRAGGGGGAAAATSSEAESSSSSSGGGVAGGSKRSSSGLAATGTTTTVSNSSNGKSFRNGSKMVSSSGNGAMASNMPRIHRKAIRTASKRFPGKSMPGKLHTVTRMGPGKIMKNTGKRLLQRPNPPICDNSNDSGLGFDNHQEQQQQLSSAVAYHTQLTIGNGSSHHRTSGTSLGTINSAPALDQHQQQQQQHQQQQQMGGTFHSPNSAGGHLPSPSLSANSRAQEQNQLMKRRRGGAATKIQIDSDDACSNDAFVFAQQQRQQQQQYLMDIVAAANASPGMSSSSLSPLSSDSSASPGGARTSAAMNVNEILAASAATTTVSPGKSCTAPRSTVRRQVNQVNLQQGGTGLSKNGRYQLQILAQPEQQHRARYQTEGSRGAVKDRSGNSFPIVRLQGYEKPALLEVFIGTDVGRVAPHMFYQACKVSGKNSTPCTEKKEEGTMIIELELRPEQEMLVTCDCVGILKERNVDVEHRFPDQSSQRSKKKSTRCRMVFRTSITHEDGTTEQLQVCSQPIICTQPPGVPEICKKSLISCPVLGGFELFVVGKNFAKDTKMIFQSQKMTGEVLWQEIVVPDKEYLQQTHLICTIPPYVDNHIRDPVTVQLYAMANGRKSEFHNFVYTPKEDRYSAIPSYSLQSHVAEDLQRMDLKNTATGTTTVTSVAAAGSSQTALPMEQQQHWNNMSPQDTTDCGMMPPPNTTLSMSLRRSSSGAILNSLVDQLSPTSSCSSNCSLKVEVHDESSQGSLGEMPTLPLMLATPENLVKQEEMQMVHQNMMMNGLSNQIVQGPATAPIQFTDQQLTTISQAINATTTIPATSSVMDVGGGATASAAIQMDTGNAAQPVNLMVPNCTAADIILNSHSVILGTSPIGNSGDGVVVVSADPTSPTGQSMSLVGVAMERGNISPDVILNPTVTPRLLCDPVPVVVVPTTSSAAVEGSGSLLVDPMLSVAPLVVDPMMGNSPASASGSLQSPQSPNSSNGGVTTTAEVVQNVQNMILNAAAEILVSQQTTISNESMQAIISLNNAASMLNEQQDPVAVNPIYNGSPPVVPVEDPNLVMMVQQGSNLMAEAQVPVSQVAMGVPGDIHMRVMHDDIGHLTGVPAVTDGLMVSTGMGVSDLMLSSAPVTAVNGPAVVSVGASDQGSLVGVSLASENNSRVSLADVVPVTSNALIAALSGGPLMGGTAGSTVGVSSAVSQGEVKTVNPGGQQQQQQQPPASIPQEIATMSEHDLISYINPNCFEQEFQNI